MVGTASDGPRAGDEREFLAALHAALLRVPYGSNLLYSGGLDSSLLAHCLQHLGRAPVLWVVGLSGAKDLAAARDGAERLGLPLHEVVIDPGELRSLLEPGTLGIGEHREPTRSVRAALELALGRTPGPSVVCGQGADELFGGYARYRAQAPEAAEANRRDDLDRLRRTEWPWTEARALALGRTILAPYLDPAVVDAALRLPISEVDGRSLTKPRLRAIAADHGLPEALSQRPKRAMQYGSGVRRALGSDVGPEALN